jgi:hypothetical protein
MSSERLNDIAVELTGLERRANGKLILNCCYRIIKGRPFRSRL